MFRTTFFDLCWAGEEVPHVCQGTNLFLYPLPVRVKGRISFQYAEIVVWFLKMLLGSIFFKIKNKKQNLVTFETSQLIPICLDVAALYFELEKKKEREIENPNNNVLLIE